MPIGKNQCRWRTIGSTDNCGKSCLGDYCWVHMARLRHSRGTRPCSVCGRGVKNVYDLCQNCGYKRAFMQNWKRDNKAFQNEFNRLARIEVLLERCKVAVYLTYWVRMMTVDEYLEWLLSGDQPKRRGRGRGLRRSQKVIRDVVQNILDEPIPEETKKRLLKPLLPRPLPPPRKRKIEKRTGLLREFDPLHAETKRKHDVKWSELVPLLADNNKLPQYVLSGRAGIMKDYTAAVPIGHHQEADALAFLHSMIPSKTSSREKAASSSH
jgi:hypothetical protein